MNWDKPKLVRVQDPWVWNYYITRSDEEMGKICDDVLESRLDLGFYSVENGLLKKVNRLIKSGSVGEKRSFLRDRSHAESEGFHIENFVNG